jgi:preprotein translocase subunit SecB
LPDTQPENAAGEQPKVGFHVRRHYLKDLSVENPRGPITADGIHDLKVDLDGRVEVQSKEGDHRGVPEHYDVVECTLRVTASRDSDVMLLCEITYAAEVSLENVPEPVRPQILSTSVPQFMMPLIGRVLDLGARAAGYPELKVSEIDFLAAFNRAGGQEAWKRDLKKPVNVD